MTELDVIVVGYRSEPFLPRLFSDLENMTRLKYELHYFDNTGNPKTLSRAWNELASRGKARYLVILNPDTALSPGWDERMVSVLTAHSNVGIATADPSPFALSAPSVEVMSALSKERQDRTDLGTNPVQFFVAFMERATWERLQGVDERMRFYMQDIDFIVRAKERLNKICVRVFACPIWHAGSASTKEASSQKEIDPQKECDFGSYIFSAVRHNGMKEWDRLTPEERDSIRLDLQYSVIPKAY